MTVNTRVALVAAFALACGGSGERQEQSRLPAAQPVAALPADVQQAITVANAMATAPHAADSVLAAHGFTQEGFDSLMYAIALDSAKSAAYAAARQH